MSRAMTSRAGLGGTERVTESGQVSNPACQLCRPRAHSGLKKKINKTPTPRRPSSSPLRFLSLTAQREVGQWCVCVCACTCVSSKAGIREKSGRKRVMEEKRLNSS